MPVSQPLQTHSGAFIPISASSSRSALIDPPSRTRVVFREVCLSLRCFFRHCRARSAHALRTLFSNPWSLSCPSYNTVRWCCKLVSLKRCWELVSRTHILFAILARGVVERVARRARRVMWSIVVGSVGRVVGRVWRAGVAGRVVRGW